MTNSFQSTAATNIYDAPVSTFVNPVRVSPKTSLVALAETLQVVNPVLQTYLGGILEKEKQAGILQGEIDVLMADPKKLKEFTNALKSTNKKEAKNILGNNIFVRAGIEKRIAINNGLAIEGKLNQFLNNKTITVEGTNGSVRNVPLKEFSVNSKEFKDAIAEFSETQKFDVTGIRPSFINQYFMPKVAESISKAYITQEENNREFVTEQTNTSLKNNILANFSTIDFTKLDNIDITNPDSQFNIAQKAIQEEIDLLDAIGATNSVSPTAMKENVLDIAEQIFNIHQNRGQSGVVAVQNFRKLIENLKVGPVQTLKDGTKVQATLGDFLGEDWNKMKARLVTNENAYDTFKKRKIAEVIKPQIISLLDKFQFQIEGADGTLKYNTEGLEALQALFPDTPEIFLDAIEEVDVIRDEFYDDFAVDIINQNFASPLEALQRLRQFEASLGSTITEEDTTELNALKDMIKTYLGKDALALYRPRIDALIAQSKDILGGNSLVDSWKSRSTKGKNIELKYYDATNTFNKRILEIMKKNLDPETLDIEINNAMEDYAAAILRINDVKTVDSYILKEDGIWSNAKKKLKGQLTEEKESEIQPITISQSTFETMQANGEVEERDNKFYIKGSNTLINIDESTTSSEENKKPTGIREGFKSLFEEKDINTNNETTTKGDINTSKETNKETNNKSSNVSLPAVESRVITELTKMGGVTKENIDKLIEQVIAEKEKMIFTNVAGKSEADRILRFLRTGQYGYGFKGEGLRIYEPIKELVDTNNFEAGTFTEGGFTTFEIESGDSLSAISNDFGIPMEAIMKANGITNANQIDIGDVLLIPEGVDYTDLNNVNFIENLDKTKIITELEHPYAPVRRKHNFQVVYNLAKKAGIKFPEVVAAQFGVESVFGSKITGTNNYFGIKADEQDIATGNFTEADTFEEINGKKVKVKAKFKNFKSLEESIQHYKKFWNDDFKDRKGIINVNTSEEAIIRLKENGYATDSDYVKLVTGVLNDAIRDKFF